MRKFTIKEFRKKSLGRLMLIVFCLLSTAVLQAQVRNYSLIYSDNIQGGTAMYGNTLMAIVDTGAVNLTKMNGNSVDGNSIYGNDNENMQYVDIDGATGNGSVTRNSSSADLVMPVGSNVIKLARLYWGGRIKNSDFDLTAAANKSIKIRKGNTSTYSDVVSLGIDKVTISTGYTQYQAYADITAFVKNNGVGTYEVGNAPLSTGAIAGGGNHGGWCIVVVYENSTLNYSSVRIYDGFQQVYNGASAFTTTVTLTGLNVPSGTLAADDAKMGVLSWEGDANLSKDYLKINNNLFSNATNPADNPWNGTITDNGLHVTTKNPDYTNQMGIDIDQFDVGTGYGILPNANSVKLEFGTEADQYFPGLFTFAIKMKDPTITLDKTVTDANNNHLGEKNEVLTYSLTGSNNGDGNANSIVISDTLPNTVTYVPNSLKIMSSPGLNPGSLTDAAGDDAAEYIVNGSIKTVRFRIGTGATTTTGGTLATNETYDVQFKVTVNDPGFNKAVPSILNIARISATSDAGVDFVDDGTAIINPDNGPLPVTLVSFNASLFSNSSVKLDWKTSMEINCSKYKIERSLDGNIFSEVVSVNGNGTTSILHSYSATDDIGACTGCVVYYRLKQLDIDGKGSYSKVVSVKIKQLDKSLVISPNPFNSYLDVTMNCNKAETITARITNIQGKEMLIKRIQMNKGTNFIKIDELSKLPTGNYFIQFISSEEKYSAKITKQ
ncbi:MAG: T9SS type A sorting domain-containing protein [Bacteroidota bacterium]|nr:T9SS type A sorting domain-containing protein [Bacteroidota bacterium]